MTVTDYVLPVVDVVLWVAIVRHRVRSGRGGVLWWACVCMALAIALKIGFVAHPLNRATGGVYLDELAAQLLGVTFAALLTRWLFPAGATGRALLTAATVVVSGVLVGTWFAAPVYDIPPEAPWIPADVLATPILLVHWLVLEGALTVFAVVFAVRAGALVRRLPPGPARVSTALLVGAAVLLGVCFGLGAAARIGALAGGALPGWLLGVENVLLVGCFVLFTAAVVARFARGGEPAPERVRTG